MKIEDHRQRKALTPRQDLISILFFGIAADLDSPECVGWRRSAAGESRASEGSPEAVRQ